MHHFLLSLNTHFFCPALFVSGQTGFVGLGGTTKTWKIYLSRKNSEMGGYSKCNHASIIPHSNLWKKKYASLELHIGGQGQNS